VSTQSVPPRPDAATLREVPCLFCGVRDEEVRFVEEPFRVVRCRRCSLTYVNPRLPSDTLHAMYQEDYWESERARDFGYTAYLADAALYLETFRMRSEVLAPYARPPGRVLEVGCAAGFFLRVMEDAGWTTTGLEIARPMVEHARRELGLPDVRHGDLLDIELPERHYDVIALWDVIEHLEDPREHLARAVPLLADDGVVVIETQNVASWFARALGRRWTHYKHEEHLYHFDPATVRRLLADVGLRVLENTPRRGGKYVSLDFVVERVGKVHPLLSVLASPLRLAGRVPVYVNLRDEMVLVAARA